MTPKVIVSFYELVYYDWMWGVSRAEFSIADILGADEDVSHQTLTLYIPDKDRNNHEIGTQRKWVLEAAELLTKIGGGVTIMPPTEGAGLTR